MQKLNGQRTPAGPAIDLKRLMLFIAAMALLFLYAPVREYLSWTIESPYYTHISVIPFVTAYLIYKKRREIFADNSYAPALGCVIACLGGFGLIAVSMPALAQGWGKNDAHALTAAMTVMIIIGTFIMLFGKRAFRAAGFPMLFLIFMIPLPTAAEDWVIGTLQSGSAEFVGVLFPITGVPVLRNGTVFQLPGISIEVAPQCSGIRSSLALLITAVLAGHLYLKKNWSRVLLALVVIPVTMFKNAIRIVVLSLLGLYVNRGYLESSLHRDGGILFFILALMIMAPILIVLRRSERNR